jgi:hypothetical protein
LPSRSGTGSFCSSRSRPEKQNSPDPLLGARTRRPGRAPAGCFGADANRRSANAVRSIREQADRERSRPSSGGCPGRPRGPRGRPSARPAATLCSAAAQSRSSCRSSRT